MLKHLLVPLDGSISAEKAILHARTLAQVFHAHVTLAHVLDSTPLADISIQVAPMSWQIRKSEMRAYLDTIVSQMRKDGIDADALLVEGAVTECISDFVRSNAVDLIILCSHGHGGDTAWTLGNNALQLLTRNPVHKLVVRAEHGELAETGTDPHYEHIFVPLDGSWRAECALPLAHALGQKMNATVTYAHAVRRPEMARHLPLSEEDAQLAARVTSQNRAETERYLQELRRRTGLNARAEIVDGANPGLTLLDLAARLQPDLIVMSAHGFSGARQLPFGSVANCFVMNSPAPVLIVQDELECGPTQTSDAPATRHHEAPHHMS